MRIGMTVTFLLIILSPGRTEAWVSLPKEGGDQIITTHTELAVEGRVKTDQKYYPESSGMCDSGRVGFDGWVRIEESSYESDIRALGGSTRLTKDFQARLGSAGEWSRIDVSTLLQYKQTGFSGSLRSIERSALGYWLNVANLLAEMYNKKLAWVRIGESHVQIGFTAWVAGTEMEFFDTISLQQMRNALLGKLDVEASGMGNAATRIEAVYERGQGMHANGGGMQGVEQILLTAFREFQGDIDLHDVTTIMQKIQ